MLWENLVKKRSWTMVSQRVRSILHKAVGCLSGWKLGDNQWSLGTGQGHSLCPLSAPLHHNKGGMSLTLVSSVWSRVLT